MFERLSSENNLLANIHKIIVRKEKTSNKKELLGLIKSELSILLFIEDKSDTVAKQIIKHVAAYLSQEKATLIEHLGRLNKNQLVALSDSLEADVDKLKSSLSALRALLKEQACYVEKNADGFRASLEAEKKLIDSLSQIILEEDGIRKKLIKNIEYATKLEHSRWFLNLVKGFSRLVSYRKFNIVVNGQDNVPVKGPVLIAPRHYSGDNDPSLFYAIIPRKIFFLGATDWMKNGVEVRVNTLIYRKLGVVPINRPDSLYQKSTLGLKNAFESIVRLLMLNQAVVIFPEGWPNIDSHWTKKTPYSGIIEVKAGLFHFVDYVQKKRKIQIPIIPVGVRYEEKQGAKTAIFVNIGKSFFIPISSKKVDFNPYLSKLQKEIARLSDLA